MGYDGPENSAAAAASWAERGFRGVKAKIGYPTVDEDLDVIRAMRAAVGDDVAIMVDYNQSLTPVEASQRLAALETQRITWVEEPVLAHDYAGHARIARQARVPIQCGENWWGALDLEQAIDAGASDYVMADVMKIGGVTGWQRAAALAHASALPLSSHLWSELSAQLLSVSPTAHWLEYSDWWNPILDDPLEIDNGMAIPSTKPGSGIEWNHHAVEALSI